MNRIEFIKFIIDKKSLDKEVYKKSLELDDFPIARQVLNKISNNINLEIILKTNNLIKIRSAQGELNSKLISLIKDPLLKSETKKFIDELVDQKILAPRISQENVLTNNSTNINRKDFKDANRNKKSNKKTFRNNQTLINEKTTSNILKSKKKVIRNNFSNKFSKRKILKFNLILLGIIFTIGIPYIYTNFENIRTKEKININLKLNVQDYLRLAEKNAGKKNYKGAIDNYSKVIKIEPGNAKVYYLRALMKFNLNMYAEALKDLDIYAKSNPIDAYFYEKRGLTKFFLKDFQGAIKDYDFAIKINSNDPLLYIGRAKVKENNQKFKDAVEDYSIAISIEPNNPEFYAARAAAKMSLNNFKDSLKDYKKAIKLNPSNSQYWNLRGNLYFKFEKFKKSVKDFSKAIELEPMKSLYWRNLANAKNSLKKYDESISHYSKAISLGVNNLELYNLRGLVKMRKKNFTGAIEDFTKSINLKNSNNSNKKIIDNGSLYYNRGVARGEVYNYSGALNDFTNAIKLNPYFPDAFYSRGSAKYNLQKVSDACFDYEKASLLDFSLKIPNYCKKINYKKPRDESLQQELFRQDLEKKIAIKTNRDKCYSMYERSSYANGKKNYLINPNGSVNQILWTSFGNPPDTYRKPICKISPNIVGVLNRTVTTSCPKKNKSNNRVYQKEIFLTEENLITKRPEELGLFGIKLGSEKREKFLVKYERSRPCDGNFKWSSVNNKTIGKKVKNELRRWYEYDYSEYFP